MMDDLAEMLERIRGRRILCVGDVMLDRFVYGEVARISPEAPIPILKIAEERTMLGAAGNVARNVTALGGEAVLVGVIGDDPSSHELARLLESETAIEPDLITVRGRATTVKVRYQAAGQQLLRVDSEDASPCGDKAEDLVLASCFAALDECDAVLLSDYAKGSLTPKIAVSLADAAQAQGKVVIADPKGRDFTRYGAVDILKPNAKELADATGMPVNTDREVEAACRRGLHLWPAKAVLVTRSAKGMAYVRRDGPAVYMPARAREVFDVSGAGDTSLAALGLAMACGADPAEALAFAIAASGVAVGKRGTAVVTPKEILALEHAGRSRAPRPAGAVNWADAKAAVSAWRADGLRVGFTNGCFDILHPGHVSLLTQAKARCDRLVVGLNADASVRRLKGAKRPVNTEDARAAVLAALEAVDLVVVFEHDTPLELIQALRPDLLVKGADYAIDQVVGADFVASYGGETYLADLKEGFSTTATVNRMAGGPL